MYRCSGYPWEQFPSAIASLQRANVVLIRQAIADAGYSVSVDIVAKICVLCAMRDTSDVVVYPREFRIIFVSRGLLECHFLVSVNRFRTVQ